MDQNQQVSTAIVACLAGGCRCPARTAGYCPTHYQQVRRHGRLTPERERKWPHWMSNSGV
jgi:hypothetical protein